LTCKLFHLLYFIYTGLPKKQRFSVSIEVANTAANKLCGLFLFGILGEACDGAPKLQPKESPKEEGAPYDRRRRRACAAGTPGVCFSGPAPRLSPRLLLRLCDVLGNLGTGRGSRTAVPYDRFSAAWLQKVLRIHR